LRRSADARRAIRPAPLDRIATDIDSMPGGHLALLDANPMEDEAYAASLFSVLGRRPARGLPALP